ncbi:MFS transporter [Pseudonocardia acaciae]|uniref:MFS transporter n=1 Tax=Pseudonocardia acaciae TaxID=551276 RepID=UPI0009FBEEB9|nr:MFS transporter [Pseudonocardia acaciae]
MTTSGPSQGRPVSIRQIATASFIGTVIEFYDFFLYGTAAALVFGKLFFPAASDLAGTLAAFATFAAGFVVRPLGGVVFGHFGDRVGRKSMLVTSLLLMGGSTMAIGLLPTYEAIGVGAPVLLVTVRLLQGIAVGGEWAGAVLMAVEHGPARRRGLYGSWPQAGAPAGLVLATAAFAAVAALPADQLLSWGWRVPFLLSVVLLAVGMFVRLRIEESGAFERVRQAGATARLPILEVLRRHPRNVLLAFGACLAPFLVFYLFSTFVLTYATTRLGIARSTALWVVVAAAALETVAIPLFALLSDRVGRKAVYVGGAGAVVVIAFPYFWLNTGGSPPMFAVTTIVGLSVVHAAMYGPLAAMFAEMFDVEVRYSGASLGYQVGGLLGGGFAPLILTALFAVAGGHYWAVGLYLVLSAVASIAAVLLVRSGGSGSASGRPVQSSQSRAIDA